MGIELVGYDTVYMPIPRCSSRWVAAALHNAGVETRTAPGPAWIDSRQCPTTQLHEKYSNYFTLVRHPRGWYESWWRHYRDVASGTHADVSYGTWDPEARIRDISRLEFPDFCIESIKRHKGGYLTWLYKQFTEVPEKSALYTGRAHEASLALPRILNAIGVKYDVNKLLRTPTIGKSQEYPAPLPVSLKEDLIRHESGAMQLWIDS